MRQIFQIRDSADGDVGRGIIVRVESYAGDVELLPRPRMELGWSWRLLLLVIVLGLYYWDV